MKVKPSGRFVRSASLLIVGKHICQGQRGSVGKETNPVTREEEIFVNLVILHTNRVFYAMKDGLVVKLEGLHRDVWWFFSLPIPLAVWERTQLVRNDAFVAFVERCRNWK